MSTFFVGTNWTQTFSTAVVSLAILSERRDPSLGLPRWLFAMLLASGLACSGLLSGTRLVADDQAGKQSTETFGPIGPAKRSLPPTETEEKEKGTRPITVKGVAKDSAGKPVSGATVYLTANSWRDRVVAKTKTDDAGKYAFNSVEFPNEAGSANVFATANSFGMTWHGMRSLVDAKTLASYPQGIAERSVDSDKPIEMNLQFPPPATLFGIIHDGDGKPIANATVRIRQLDYLDPTGKATHVNYREFNGLHLAPERYRVSKTDANGKFQFSDLPFQTYALLGVEHAEYAHKSLYAAITDKRIREFQRPSGSAATIRNGQQVNFITYNSTPVSVNPVRVRLHSTQQTTVRAVDKDGKPLQGMQVTVFSSNDGERISVYGKTNESGIVKLKVPPGKHQLRIRPQRVTDRVEARGEIEIVAGENPKRDVIVPLGGKLLARVVDADTGKPIPGVGFAIKEGTRTSGLNSVPHYVDHPKTDANGELRALLPSGMHQIGLGFSPLPKGYRVDGRMRNVRVESGKVVTETFRLERE